MTTPRDLKGQEICVGDRVAYAALDGCSAVLRYGEVVALAEREEWCYSPNHPGHDKHTIPTVKVKIMNGGAHYYAPLGKIVTLGFPNRMVVLREREEA